MRVFSVRCTTKFIVLLLALLASPAGVHKLSAQGDLSFTRSDFGVGVSPRSVTVGDFNGDTIEDLATANFQIPGSVSILLGNGDGTFLSAQDFGAGVGPTSVTVGDFNGDTIEDLAIDNSAPGWLRQSFER